jgi:hypothetical protein
MMNKRAIDCGFRSEVDLMRDVRAVKLAFPHYVDRKDWYCLAKTRIMYAKLAKIEKRFKDIKGHMRIARAAIRILRQIEA